MAKNGHSGHRQRLRARAEKYGIDSLEEHEFLELLLFYAVARKNTNPMAHELLEYFGSLAGVFKATPEELEKAGLTKRAAFWLYFVANFSDVYKSYYRSQERRGNIITPELTAFVSEKCSAAPKGTLFCVFLSSGGQVIYSEAIRYDKSDETSCIRSVGRASVRSKAYYAVFAFAHDTMSPLPSIDECRAASKICSALKALDVAVLDFFHHTPDSCRSYKSMGALFPSESELYNSTFYKLLSFDKPLY